MDKKNLAFDKMNFILVAPTVTLIGFLSIIYAVIRKPKDN